MKETWYRFRVKLTSSSTDQSHFEEVYLAEGCKDKLLSYATLKRLGHINEDTFLKNIKQKKLIHNRGKLRVHSFLSKCEESTVNDKEAMEYLCSCARRIFLMTVEDKLLKKGQTQNEL